MGENKARQRWWSKISGGTTPSCGQSLLWKRLCCQPTERLHSPMRGVALLLLAACVLLLPVTAQDAGGSGSGSGSGNSEPEIDPQKVCGMARPDLAVSAGLNRYVNEKASFVAKLAETKKILTPILN